MKKRLATAFTALIIAASITTAGAYYFPEPDWDALLKERERMVNETDFDLYTQGGVDCSPYYGARLEPRGGAYIGMIAEHSEEFRPLGSYLTYVEGMGQFDLYYPANNIVREGNSVVMVGWTITDLDSINYTTVESVLNTLEGYNKPIFIRFANEMNTDGLGDNPDKYKEAFRKVADMVHTHSNMATVWSPLDLGSLDRDYKYYYPGDEYVDWVGVSCYSIKYFLGNPKTSYKDSVYFMTGDYSWATNRLKPIIQFMKNNNISKPVMISEGGVATWNSNGDWLEPWSTPRMRNMLYSVIMKYPQVKMINYFNVARNELNRYDITDYKYACDIFKEAESSGAYIRAYGSDPDFVYTPASAGVTLKADNNGTVPLYTLAYIPKNPDISVHYRIDGTWYHSSENIPYTCNLNISGLSDGKHTIKINTLNHEKSYEFYKKGRRIRFGGEPDFSDAINVTLNGQKLNFEVEPEIINERTMVPMRVIFEALGANVTWNGDTKGITAVCGDRNIYLQIGSSTMNLNSNTVTLDASPYLCDGSTMVPVRAVAEAFDCIVGWDSGSRTVSITK